MNWFCVFFCSAPHVLILAMGRRNSGSHLVTEGLMEEKRFLQGSLETQGAWCLMGGKGSRCKSATGVVQVTGKLATGFHGCRGYIKGQERFEEFASKDRKCINLRRFSFKGRSLSLAAPGPVPKALNFQTRAFCFNHLLCDLKQVIPPL